MATITSLLNSDGSQLSRNLRVVTKTYAVPSSGISNGDNVQLYVYPVDAPPVRLHSASLYVDATLGASATAKLQVNRAGTRTDLTAATTAGAASKVTSAAANTVPFDLRGGDIIEILAGGANFASAANATFDLLVSPR